MKAVVFSGTTEGRRFSKKLAELGAAVTVCVATPLGAEEQGEMAGITVHAGRLQPDAMAALLAGADLCVDATHPYAVDATRNIRAAAVQAGVEYRRPHRNIIAMQGPFSLAMNKALITQFQIRYLVTKDGGAAGGFAEKVQAAADTGAQLVVLRRPPETGETEIQILAYCKEILQWSH